jgi:hypothetical protein
MKDILDLLMMDKHYGVSYDVDIAKGLYKLPHTFTECKEKVVRIIKSK